MRKGVAAHITGASENGPRYDKSLTAEQRKSAKNGIWLCENCGRIVDESPDAWTAEGLDSWKRVAEGRAARDATASQDEIADLSELIEATATAIIEFSAVWEAGEPLFEFESFEESTRRSMEYLGKRRTAYDQEISPRVAEVLVRAAAVLGPADPYLVAAEAEKVPAPTNYLSMRSFANCLHALKATLALR